MEIDSLPAQGSIFQKLAYLVFLVGTFLLPLAFFPALANAFELPKWTVLVAMVLLGLVFWALEALRSKQLALEINTLTKPLVALGLVYILVDIINSPNRVSPLWGKTGLVLAGVVFYLLATSLLGKKARHLFWSLVASSFLVSWAAIFSYLEVLPKLLPNLVIADKRFTPTGGPLALLSFLAVLLPATVVLGLKKKDSLIKILLFVVAAVQAIALILTTSLLLPAQTTTPLALLPYSAGWSIAVDQFKTFRSALLGVSPDNFLSAFTRFRPIELNSSSLWSMRFTASSNELFSILTTTGLVGLLVFIWLSSAIVILLRQKSANALNLSLGLAMSLVLLSFLVIPANTVLLFIFFVFAATLAGEETSRSVALRQRLAMLLAVVLLVLAGGLGYLAGRVLAAERLYSQSLQAAAKNEGTSTYNLQIKALQLNPFEFRYRLAYSNTNLALANSLASKENLSDDDRKTITQLVSQAIREGKNAVALAPENPAAWENLANIYRQLINFAQGADQWTLTAYVQAVRLDPTNPRLRVDLGGFLYSLKEYDSAIDQFKRAIDLKPDYANAYYNLSYAYKQKKDLVQAYSALQAAVNLVDKDSADFDKANSELEQLKSQLPEELKTATAAAAKKPSQLVAPQPLPSPQPGRSRLPLNPQEQQRLAPELPASPAPTTEETEPLPSPSPSASPQG